MKKYLFSIAVLILIAVSVLQASGVGLQVLMPSQGGTGIGSAASTGLCLKVLTTSPLRYELGDCGSGSGSTATTTINGLAGPDFTFVPLFSGSSFTIATTSTSTIFTIPKNLSAFTNDTPFLTAETDPIWISASSSYLTTANASSTYYRITNPAGYITSTGISGTANYFPFYASSTALTSTSSIFQLNGSIGIGTTTPANLLDVVGNIPSDTVGIGIKNFGATSNADFIMANSTQEWKMGVNSENNFRFRDATNGRNIFVIEDGAPASSIYIYSTGVITTIGGMSLGGNVTSTTLDTGQGANELYDMNQNVQTTDSPTFVGLTLSGEVSKDGTPNSDHSAVGDVTNTFNSGATTTVMDLVYMGSGGKWLVTDADATSTTRGMLAISLESKNDTQAMKVALKGSFVRDDTWNWTPGQTLYASTDLGQATSTVPAGSGDAVRVLGYAVTADVIYFTPSEDYIELL